jgi:metallo-beta-lactamase family protein
VVLNGLSSHADQPDLLRMLAPLRASAPKVRLVHGEPERADALTAALRAAGFADVSAPEPGDAVDV